MYQRTARHQHHRHTQAVAHGNNGYTLFEVPGCSVPPQNVAYRDFALPGHPFYQRRNGMADLCQRWTPSLALFVGFILKRVGCPSPPTSNPIILSALYLLSSLKSRFPQVQAGSGHRLFITAFMVASKIIDDHAYSNKSFTVLAQGLFSLDEINQMERELCEYLGWDLHILPTDLQDFENKVLKHYEIGGECPPFVYPPLAHPQSLRSQQPVSDNPHHPLMHPRPLSAPACPDTIPVRPGNLPADGSYSSSSSPGQPARPQMSHAESPATYLKTGVNINLRLSSPSDDRQRAKSSSQTPPPTLPTSEVTKSRRIVTTPTIPLAIDEDTSMNSAGRAYLQPKSQSGRDQYYAYPSASYW